MFLQNYTGYKRWKADFIIKKTGPVSYDFMFGNDVEHEHESKLCKSQPAGFEESSKKEIDNKVIWRLYMQKKAQSSLCYVCCVAFYAKNESAFVNTSSSAANYSVYINYLRLSSITGDTGVRGDKLSDN